MESNRAIYLLSRNRSPGSLLIAINVSQDRKRENERSGGDKNEDEKGIRISWKLTRFDPRFSELSAVGIDNCRRRTFLSSKINRHFFPPSFFSMFTNPFFYSPSLPATFDSETLTREHSIWETFDSEMFYSLTLGSEMFEPGDAGFSNVPFSERSILGDTEFSDSRNPAESSIRKCLIDVPRISCKRSFIRVSCIFLLLILRLKYALGV